MAGACAGPELRRAARRPPRRPPQSRRSAAAGCIQVGAFPAEQEAKQRLSAVQSKAAKMLAGTDPYTESVAKGRHDLLPRPLCRLRQGQGGSRLQVSQA